MLQFTINQADIFNSLVLPEPTVQNSEIFNNSAITESSKPSHFENLGPTDLLLVLILDTVSEAEAAQWCMKPTRSVSQV